MAKPNRYVAHIEAYVWADTDMDAIKQAKQVAKEWDDKEDNGAQLILIVEQPFGELDNRPIDILETEMRVANSN